MRKHLLGLFEKAFPSNLSWPEKLLMAKKANFDYVEISIDESDEKLARLEWSKAQKVEFKKWQLDTEIRVPSMCLSGHRKYPFGSHDAKTRERAYDIMKKAVDFAVDTGLRTIQLAGLDVFYEQSDSLTYDNFVKGIKWATEYAAANQVMLAVETVPKPFIDSIEKWKVFDDIVKSPWFCVYPDVGNLSGTNKDVVKDLTLGIDKIASIHLKETLKRTNDFKGQFKKVRFSQGNVDFEEIFRTLKLLNYRGSFLLEMWCSHEDNYDLALQELIFAREYIEKEMLAVGVLL